MRWFLALIIAALLAGCSIPEPLVERIKDEGTLLVITRNSPTTYYEGPQGYKGFEYELVEMFAKELGVKVKYIIPDSFADILPMITSGEAHLAAAGLTMTPKRETMVRFSPSYQQITQQVIYRSGNKRPRKITDTLSGTLEIIAGSSHEEQLEKLREKHPELKWIAQTNLESEELLYLVNEQVIDYTIADSNEAALSLQLYADLKVAFDLTEPQPLAWAFQHAEDSSLYDAAAAFIEEQKKNGALKQLIERYYGHVKRLGFVDKRTFTRHIAKRLPDLAPLFQKAGEKTDLDWQLLAAIGYQESHWNPKAVSPTGVKGIMMLTNATAKQLDIEDRTDPAQSIMGGARYVRLVEKKLPKRIKNPDRLWLALAGYNVGYGHLEDARILTQRGGGNPDKWADVKQYLPLLSQEKHFKTVKHGYARGREPVTYVDNIRNYYELLVWHNQQQAPPVEKPKEPLKVTTPAML
ncbi:MAG: membrane-bound lytic murein transglycosylase MltF [Sedimenticola sp.]